MAKLIVLQGLVASGKSTYAAQLLKECGNGIRINRDLLREMLHCGVWSGKNEGVTKKAARVLAKQFLERETIDTLDASYQKPGIVVIDDTNLDPGTVASWKQLAQMCGASWELIDLPTPVDECLRRDRLRERPVGDHIIIGMALQYHRYPLPDAGIVLCDIDGTVADTRRRVPFLQQDPKNWEAFFEDMDQDPVIETVAREVLLDIASGRQLFFVSGRPETNRAVTERWLQDAGLGMYQTVFMRRAGDHRPDTVVKQEILDRYFPEPYRSQIVRVWDDRPSVCREVWEKAGLPLTQCGTGEEF